MLDKKPAKFAGFLISGDPGEARTHDQWLKRPLLYQLSYRIKKIKFSRDKINIYFFIIIKKIYLNSPSEHVVSNPPLVL